VIVIVSTATDVAFTHDDVMYPSAIPFVLVHLGCFAALWSGITYDALLIGALLYWLRMFAISAGYHRYFSHRAYSTSRVFQFVVAFLAQSSAQKSVLWWAAKHRTITCMLILRKMSIHRYIRASSIVILDGSSCGSMMLQIWSKSQILPAFRN
jgi:hypothetical protein